MKATIKTVTTVTLELSADESEWLRLVMQNPINVKPEEPEPAQDAIMRAKLFQALPGRLF